MALTRKQIIIGSSVLVAALVVGGVSVAALTNPTPTSTTEVAAPKPTDSTGDQKDDDKKPTTPSSTTSPTNPPKDDDDIIDLDGFDDPNRDRETNPTPRPTPPVVPPTTPPVEPENPVKPVDPKPVVPVDPVVPEPTPTPTETPVDPEPTPTPTETPVVPEPTPTPTPTETPVDPTPTPTPTPTETPVDPIIDPEADYVSAENVDDFIVKYNSIRAEKGLKPLPVDRFQVPANDPALCWNKKNTGNVAYILERIATVSDPSNPNPHENPCGRTEVAYQGWGKNFPSNSPLIRNGADAAQGWWSSPSHRLAIYTAPQANTPLACLTFSSGFGSTPGQGDGTINYAYSAVATWQACDFAGTIPAVKANAALEDYVLPEVVTGGN